MSSTSENLEGYSFLKRVVDDDLLRSSAQNILDSYGHAWDVLAESLQNAVDAVEQHALMDPNCVKRIKIGFNCRTREIEVSDTGIGISKQELLEIMTPGKSLKRGINPTLRGEKGVGLSFLVFISNRFRIETCDGTATVSLEIRDAANWVRDSAFTQPCFTNVKVEKALKYEGSTRYTRIWVGGISDRPESGEDVFGFTKHRLIHLLRTKTAIGHTAPVFYNRPPDCDIRVTLKYTDTDGISESEDQVEYRYATPDSYLKSSEVVEWDRYMTLAQSNKHKSVSGKSLVRVGESTSEGGRAIRWYVFASSRRYYDHICDQHSLTNGEDLDIEGGIYLCTKGMPTGVQITPPKSGQAAYWPSLYILLEYNNIKWDVGRKFVGGRTLEMLKKTLLKDIFNGIVDHLSNFIAGSTPALAGLDNQQELDEVRTRSLALNDLKLKKVSYLKEPAEEQGVVALFYEMIGAGLIKGYRTYSNFGKDRYDAFVKVEATTGKPYNVFVEFKYEATSILRDFEDKKRPRDIRLLICWTINKDKFIKDNFEIDEVNEGDTGVPFPSVTHQLTLPGRYLFGNDNIISVLCLSDLVSRLKVSQK